MAIRFTQSLMALGLVLGCVVAQTAAQNRSAAQPRASLWSVLNLPTLDGFSKPTMSQPRSLPIAHADQRSPTPASTAQQEKPPAPVPVLANEPKPAKRPPEPEPETATASSFSPSNSSRRSVVQKRELADNKTVAPRLDLDLTGSPHPTPHWTPKFGVQAGCLQLSDDERARPVAVNMAGDLISERATAARAVKRFDPTLRISPSMINAKRQQPSHDNAADAEKSVSAGSDTAAQLATALPAAAR